MDVKELLAENDGKLAHHVMRVIVNLFPPLLQHLWGLLWRVWPKDVIATIKHCRATSAGKTGVVRRGQQGGERGVETDCQKGNRRDLRLLARFLSRRWKVNLPQAPEYRHLFGEELCMGKKNHGDIRKA
jgi:hypothetical protein